MMKARITDAVTICRSLDYLSFGPSRLRFINVSRSIGQTTSKGYLATATDATYSVLPRPTSWIAAAYR